MKYITKDKLFYQQLINIALPIALTMFINLGVSTADTVMLGTLSEIHLSAVALANQLGFIFTLLIIGIGGGASVMVSQYWGKREIKTIHNILAIMYRILLVSSVCFTMLAFFFNRQIMGIFTTDPQVIGEGARFLRIVGFSYLTVGLSYPTLVMLRSVGTVKIALVTYGISLTIKVFLNWIFIFGNLGAPRMEIEGAAMATVISRLIEVGIVCLFVFKLEKKIKFRLRHLFLRKLGLLRDFIKYAGPVVINEVTWGIGYAIVILIIGRMSTEFIAAYSISHLLSQLVTITNFGIAGASAVIIGNTVGAGEYEKAKIYGTTFVFISLVHGVISFGLMQVFKYPMLSLYNISDLAVQYSIQLINIYSVIIIFQCVSIMTLVGVLRGGGDTRYVMIVEAAFMWLFSVPFGFVTGLHLGLAVPIVYVIIRGDDILKAVISTFRIMSGRWITDVTKSTNT